METLELIPNSHLGEFIDKIYVNYSDNFNFQGIAEPFLHPELFFSFGKQFQIGQNNFSGDASNYSAIIGNRSNSVQVRTYGYHLTAGVIFKPWGIYSTFGIDGKRTINHLLKITNSSQLKKTIGFADLNNVAPEAILDKLESTMKGLVRNCKIKDSFQKSYSIINKMSIEQANLNEVASTVKLSKKTIIEQFNEHLGISPVKFIHVKTIIESLRLLKSNKNVNLTGLAYDLGFYDQSHFIRVFKSCMAMTPSEYVRYLSRVNIVQF